MRTRSALFLTLALVSSLAGAQDGIGDPTFPTLGNKGYKATHYGLKINYNPDTNLLKGDVTMDAVSDGDLSGFSVDFSGFEISAVKLNGVAVPYERTAAKLRIKGALKAGAKFSLETIYSGQPSQQQSGALPVGMKSGWIKYAGGAVAVCEPDLAHTWFPCNDHPLNKATFDIDVTAPAKYVTVANGVEGVHSHFVLDKPGMTCMAMVAFGKFGILKQAGPNHLAITNYMPVGSEASMLGSLAVTPKFMEFLSERIGPYPYSSYGTVILPQEVSAVNMLMSGSAIETTSIPVFGPGGATEAQTLCHELTHQWMGNCVSVTNWGEDIWWVEGFAQYSEWLVSEMQQGKAAYEKVAKAVYDQVSAGGHGLKPGRLKAAQLFEANSYIGGGLTFFALRKQVGDDKFFQIVRQFVDKNRYGNGCTKDWVEIATKVAGQDMKPFFDAWLYGDAIPKLSD